MTIWLMSFPAFASLLALFALVESAWRWFTGLGLIPWLRRRTGQSLSNIAFDEFTAVVNGNKTVELEQRRVELLRRDDESDGAPPRSSIDLIKGTAVIVLPQGANGPCAGDPEALEGRQ
ncbi:DUF6191 domain-containing protein [Streptomyces sp. NPDC048436]|uniref:DUF6191 domain-containing protein n=1 Tax=Streptomyces sp. NPDC048436 TaxID=3365550 RepID=UPI0037128DA8